MLHLIVALSVAILIAIFVTLNNAWVSVNFIFWNSPSFPLALIILFSVLLGVVLTTLFEIPEYYQLWQNKRELEKKLKSYEETIRPYHEENREAHS